jgi:hypothetical protein
MLRLTPRHKRKVSHRLAIFAGVLLLISSLAGMHRANLQEQMSPANFAQNNGAFLEQPLANTATQKHASKKKGFKVSLLLFRLD